MEQSTNIVNNRLKKWITAAFIVAFGAISVIFTILCMRYFKSGILFEYNTIITSTLIAAEMVCMGLCFAFFLTEKEAAYKLLLTALGLAAFFLTGLYILQVTGVLDKIDSVEDLRLWIAHTGVWAPLCFIIIQFLLFCSRDYLLYFFNRKIVCQNSYLPEFSAKKNVPNDIMTCH